MTKAPKRPRDLNQWAKRMVDIATGETTDREPTPEEQGKDPAAAPDMKHVSTSYAERNNLNIRMHSRRMTRLTNAFSKKMENHAYAMALHFLYYNFVRIHKTLKVSPAMAAGVTDRLWEVADMVNVLGAWEATDFQLSRM